MKITVEYFAQLRTTAKIDREQFVLPEGATVHDLVAAICSQHHGLIGESGEMPGWVTIVLGEQAITPDHPLADGDVVRFLAPISGG